MGFKNVHYLNWTHYISWYSEFTPVKRRSTYYFRMIEFPNVTEVDDKQSKSEDAFPRIVNGKEIKTYAELGRDEYLKEFQSPKLKYG